MHKFLLPLAGLMMAAPLAAQPADPAAPAAAASAANPAELGVVAPTVAPTEATPAAAEAPATAAPAPTTAANGVAPGAKVYDTAGTEIAMVESVSGDSAIVSVGKGKLTIPLASFGAGAKGPVLAATRAQLEAASRAG